MERVVELLGRNDLRQALVRLWVLGLDGPRLNRWEQTRGDEATLATKRLQFLSDLQNQITPSQTRIEAAPLALIRALDDFVAHANSPYNPVARFASASLTRRENEKDYWLVPVNLKARRDASLNKQPGNLGAWFHRHAVLPATTAHGLRVTISVSESTLAVGLDRLWSNPKPILKVWISHFNDKADVQWARNAIGNWRTTVVDPKDERKQSLLAAVDSAVEAGANIIVFPEFTLDLEHRQALLKYLRRNPPATLLMVVAGSFHETEGAKTFNSAPVYCCDTGEVLFTHRKLRIFGDLIHGEDHGAEQVDLGDAIHVLVTPVGCMTVLICKDFLDVHPSLESLLTEVPVDWVLVPSFGDEKTIHAHKAKAKALATIKTGTNTVISQTQNTAKKPVQPPTECVRGFGHAAGCKEPELQVGETGGLVIFALSQQPAVELPKPRQPSLTRIK